MGDHGLVVVGLAAENVKRIRAVEIKPPRIGVVEIAGRNNAGKSTVLDAIVYALGGKAVQPEMPVRKGEKSAKVVLELEDLVVTRTWAEKGSYLTVERQAPGGERLRVAKPQEFLDRIVGAGLGFDPTEFIRMKPAEQGELLLRLLQLPEDPRELDRERADVMLTRTGVNREVRRLQGALASMPAVEAPDEEVSITALLEERDRLSGENEDNAVFREAAANAARAAEAARATVERLRRELADAEAALEAATAAAEQADLLASQKADHDLAPLTARIAGAERTNEVVRAKRERAKTEAELKRVEAESAKLTERIEQLDETKATMIAAAPFPIPGLGFADVGGVYVVTFDGVPLSQASSSLVMRVGMAIAMALNPTVRILLLREGSLLDDEARAEIEAVAAERGFQVWLEVVGKGSDAGFVIEDGGVARVPAAAAAR